MGGITSIFTFIAGGALLVFSAEKLVSYLAGAANGLKISMFTLAIIFTGIEFDDLVLGLTFNADEFHGVALGIVFGTAISFTGVVLALGAIIAPGTIRVMRDYLLMFVAAPIMLLAFALTGSFTIVDGGILIALFLAFLGYVAIREAKRHTPTYPGATMYEPTVARGSGGDAPILREAEGYVRVAESHGGTAVASDRSSDPASALPEGPFTVERRMPGWASIGLAVLCLAGIVVGASVTSDGAEAMLDAYQLDGTVFGATIATLVLTVGDIFITVEPLRKGVPDIGIANVIGSLIFSVTGKLGVTLLVGGIVVGSEALHWHLPALIIITALGAAAMWTGKLERWHGWLLLACYVAYWVVSFTVFGTAPVDTG
jgi:cation:H+ antiporter